MTKENENEKRETVADILKEWRECIEAADPSVWNDDRIAGLVKTTKAQQLAYLDRIEEAWKWEREELDKRISELEAYAKLWTGRADELRLKCDEFYAKAKPVGNSAAMRDAVVALLDAMHSLGCDEDTAALAALVPGMEDSSAKCLAAFRKAKDALSAPARNCDVGTAEEQAERYNAFCGKHFTPDKLGEIAVNAH